MTRGFTLLEVLIAISIFALIGLGSNAVLRTVVNAEDTARGVGDEVATLRRALGTMERDFTRLTLRNINDEYGDPLPALMVNTGVHPIEMTHAGWNNPAQLPRSSLQRVAYNVNSETNWYGISSWYWIVRRIPSLTPRFCSQMCRIFGYRCALTTRVLTSGRLRNCRRMVISLVSCRLT